MKAHLLLCSSFAVLAGAIPSLACAQSTPSDDASSVALEEVVVTAERRETNLQSTPLAVTSVSGETLARQPLSDFVQLSQRMPALNMNTRVGILQATIRGVGGDSASLGDDPRIAFHVDGVYIPRGSAQTGGLFDVSRLEVVEGPQGTLYGRNATGGAINVITNGPTSDLTGAASLTYGNYNLAKVDAAIGGPITDTLAFRVATQLINRDGYGKDIFTGDDIDDQKSKAIRGRLRWTPTDTVQADLSVNYYQRDDAGFAFHVNSYYPYPTVAPPPFFTRPDAIHPSDKVDNSADFPTAFFDENYGATLTLNWDINEHLRLRSMTGYQSDDFRTGSDSAGSNIKDAAQGALQRSEAYSQEFQLTGTYDRARFTLGAYAFKEDLEIGNLFALSGNFPAITAVLARVGKPLPILDAYYEYQASRGIQNDEAYAVFGEWTQEFGSLSLTVGGRYTTETKDIIRSVTTVTAPGVPLIAFSSFDKFQLPSNFGPRQKITSRKFTPRVTVGYTIDTDTYVFATYSQGFKSAAFSLSGNPLDPAANPEVLNNYEAGLRREWLDGRLRTNLTVFRYKYEDLQLQSLATTSTGSVALLLQNASEASLYGGSLDILARVSDGLTLGANLQLLHSQYDRYLAPHLNRPGEAVRDLSGNQLNRAPSYKLALTADHVSQLAKGELSLHGQATFVDRSYYTVFNETATKTPTYANFDASVRYDHGNGAWASAWVSNISNSQPRVGGNIAPTLFGNPIYEFYAPPRTFGVTLGYKF